MTKATQVDIDVATIINIIDLCKDMGTMPLPGGLFAQDALFIDLYEYVFQCRQTRLELDERQQNANQSLANAKAKRR